MLTCLQKQRLFSRQQRAEKCPVLYVMAALESPVTRVTSHSVTCFSHQTDPITEKMLPCSAAEIDRKLVKIGMSTTGIRKQNALTGKIKYMSMVARS